MLYEYGPWGQSKITDMASGVDWKVLLPSYGNFSHIGVVKATDL